MSIAKEEAKKLIDRLPDHATWDGIMYELYVKKKLAVALKAADEGTIEFSSDIGITLFPYPKIF